MKIGFLQLLGIILLLSVLSEQVVHADVAPPPELSLALSLGAVIVLGLFIAIIVFVSFWAIRTIKKKSRTPKNDA